MRRVALSGALALVCVGGVAGAAEAHATLQHATPTPNSVLAQAPARVILGFDEPVTLVPDQVLVIGPGGARADRGHAALAPDGREVVLPLRPRLGQGTYTVGYRVVSADSHPIAGGYSFQVGTATRGAQVGGGADAAIPPGVGSAGASQDGTISALYGIARYAGFVGLLLLVGGGTFLLALWPDALPTDRARRLVWLGYALVVTASAAELVLQAPYAAGTGLSGVTASGLGWVIRTPFGVAHVVRLGLLVLGAPLLAAALRGARRLPPLRLAVSASALALLFTWPYAGHAGVRDPAVSVPSDTVHLAAMSVWLGGLVVLGTALLPRSDGGALGPVLRRWSLVAMTSVALLVATGSAQSLVEVGSWTALVDSAYGRLVLTKIALLAMVLCFADVSRRWVRRHRVTPVSDRRDLAVLRRSVLAETAGAVIVVAVAAVLVATTPGRVALAASTGADRPAADPDAGRPVPGGVFSVALRRGQVVVHLVVDPGRVGANIVHLSATTPDQNRVPVQQWTLTVSNAGEGLADVDVPLHWVGGQSVGDLTLPTSGRWMLQVMARTSDVDEVVVRRAVVVR